MLPYERRALIVVGRSSISKTIGYRTKDKRRRPRSIDKRQEQRPVPRQDTVGTIETPVAPYGPRAREDTGHIPAMRCYRGRHPLLIGEIGPIGLEKHDYGLADMFEDRFSLRISEIRQKAIVPRNGIALWPKVYEETALLALSEGHPVVFESNGPSALGPS